jgi:hypothetical protein
MTPDEAMAVSTLRSPATVRARCEAILAAGLAGQLAHFSVDLDRLPIVVERVIATGMPAYGALDEAAAESFDDTLVGVTSDDTARTWVERVIAKELAAVDPQVLATAIAKAPHVFFGGRAGGLVEALAGKPDVPTPADHDATWPHRLIPAIEATAILRALLDGLASIWPGKLAIGGTPVGDVGRHPKAGGNGQSKGLVPFHTQAQSLAYTLFAPLERSGYTIAQANSLNGLADARTGGPLVELGVLVPKYLEVREIQHRWEDEIIVEWRALTIAVLERLAQAVRTQLSQSTSELTYARVIGGLCALAPAIPPIRVR